MPPSEFPAPKDITILEIEHHTPVFGGVTFEGKGGQEDREFLFVGDSVCLYGTAADLRMALQKGIEALSEREREALGKVEPGIADTDTAHDLLVSMRAEHRASGHEIGL